MPKIELRTVAGTSSPEDLTLTIQDKTFEYLVTGPAAEIRVSAYFEKDYDDVLTTYAELFLPEPFNGELCHSKFTVAKVTPGSKIRKVILPGAMKTGEQLTIQVTRI